MTTALVAEKLGGVVRSCEHRGRVNIVRNPGGVYVLNSLVFYCLCLCLVCVKVRVNPQLAAWRWELVKE